MPENSALSAVHARARGEGVADGLLEGLSVSLAAVSKRSFFFFVWEGSVSVLKEEEMSLS